MRDSLKLLIKYIMRFFLKIYYIFPIQQSILFMSTMGKSYSCNPKYLYESVLNDQRFFDYRIIWCFDSLDKNRIPTNRRVKIISRNNLISYFYHLLTAEIIVYNCGGFSYAPIRKKQFLLETWHGGGTFKNVNLTVNNKSKASKRGVELASKDISAFVGTSKVNNEMFIRNGMGYRGKIINSGFPRNDILIKNDPLVISLIKQKMNISEKAHYVLYAPTFKGQEHKAINTDTEYESIDPILIKESLEKRFGGDWFFATRGHQYAGNLVLKGADYDWSSYPDMQELLLMIDVLVTDYSSSIWDYSLTGKPCFLFVPDLERYEKEERGFLTPIEEWPAIYGKSNIELAKQITGFDENNYKEKVTEYLINCGSFERGNACSIIKDYIVERIEESKKLKCCAKRTVSL